MNEKRAKKMRRTCKFIGGVEWKEMYKHFKKLYKENGGK